MNTKEEIKNTGATFTPPELADYLANKIGNYIEGGNIQVLDPSCGDGELLLSISNCLSKREIDFTLSGYDSNLSYLNQAGSRLASCGSSNLELIHDDFLQAFDFQDKNKPLDLFSSDKKECNNNFDVVIANPPYVRTQILGTEQAQLIAKKFGLKGRVDLYYPFLVGMTQCLKVGGIIGVITSNRYLFTKSGESIREFISDNYEILELIDLGDTKLFDAAVLPAILIAKKILKKSSSLAKFIKVYEESNGYTGEYTSKHTLFDILESDESGYYVVNKKKYKKTVGSLNYSTAPESWKMLTKDESEWIKSIEFSSKLMVRDLFKVKVGIKTTADKVFLGDTWEQLGESKPEDELLKILLSQENITAWNVESNLKLKVLYPHIKHNGKKTAVNIEDFPKANKYLQGYKEILSARKYLIDSGRKWYEIWVSHDPEIWQYPKIVFPDISSSPRFTFDTEGKVVNGNCYWMVATKKNEIDNLLLIQGISNSKLMTKYHDLMFNNKLYSGRRRYLSQYVEKYPLPNLKSSSTGKIIEIVKELNLLHSEFDNTHLLHQLEIEVAKCYGVDPVFTLD